MCSVVLFSLIESPFAIARKANVERCVRVLQLILDIDYLQERRMLIR
jgi:hypothetical protein